MCNAGTICGSCSAVMREEDSRGEKERGVREVVRLIRNLGPGVGRRGVLVGSWMNWKVERRGRGL